ncbi:hypothetical protein [Paenibacillus apiarius]|uniref:ABC transporter permease n=1 Tax=Paenibacillus apiarius TaxID=46240 RepID=A0ABT4DTT5_9BACL|nr:hypothetical protein [Paenibacillus apiarius]MCY9515839.1 hypothetical protein [Paenibacillus apiarius]MCY9520749.1 hypothetical protein [Paenibacillus apiarius]MCY9553453.1 hypothetical protein [Paenibacillus apiarius]MCY9558023.1 hypothetical protein [Paenibacillus apiarius]MCY9685878.1 hypothetical protein [Paenibacillus apiarius]
MMNKRALWVLDVRESVSWILLPLGSVALVLAALLLCNPANPPSAHYMHEWAAIPFTVMMTAILTQREWSAGMMELVSTWPISHVSLVLRKLSLSVLAVVLYEAIWYAVYRVRFGKVAVKLHVYGGTEAEFRPASWWELVAIVAPAVVLFSALTLAVMVWTRRWHAGISAAFGWWMLESMTKGTLTGSASAMTFHLPDAAAFTANRIGLTVAAFVLASVSIIGLEQRERWAVSHDTD